MQFITGTNRHQSYFSTLEYQDAVDINNNNIKQNPQYYKRRQAIVEHPFGTIKRHFGFTYTLLKGLQKVNGEMNLIMFCYNFMRTKNILGFNKMLETIQNWQPDYRKIACALKNAFIKAIYRHAADCSSVAPPYSQCNVSCGFISLH